MTFLNVKIYLIAVKKMWMYMSKTVNNLHRNIFLKHYINVHEEPYNLTKVLI